MGERRGRDHRLEHTKSGIRNRSQGRFVPGTIYVGSRTRPTNNSAFVGMSRITKMNGRSMVTGIGTDVTPTTTAVAAAASFSVYGYPAARMVA